MSEGQRNLLMWVGIILFLCYLAGVNPVQVLGNFGHSAQQIHNSNSHP